TCSGPFDASARCSREAPRPSFSREGAPPVRFADIVLRRGHLSEQALAEVCLTGERPVHLDRCDICAERAVQLSRWLDELQAVVAADLSAAYHSRIVDEMRTNDFVRQHGRLTIHLAREFGFCYGVERAVDYA